MRVLATGAAGFICSYLIPELLAALEGIAAADIGQADPVLFLAGIFQGHLAGTDLDRSQTLAFGHQGGGHDPLPGRGRHGRCLLGGAQQALRRR